MNTWEARHNVQKFVFQTYEKIKYKSKKYDDLFCIMKLGVLGLAIVVFGMMYIVYVTKASTRGYFYRVEATKLAQVKFEYNLTNLKVMEHKERLWSAISFSNSPTQSVKVNSQVVKVPVNQKVAYNK